MIISKIKLSKKRIVYVLFSFLLLMVFMRYGLQINIPREILLAVATSILILGDTNELIAICISCIPLHTSLDYLYVLLIGIAIFVIKNAKKIKIDMISIVILLIIIWEIMHGFMGTFSFKHEVAIMMPFLLVWMLHSVRRQTYSYDFIMKIYSIFVIGVGATLLSKTMLSSGFNIQQSIRNMQRLGNVEEDTEILGGTINPNSLGIMCVLGITVLLQKVSYGNKKKSDIVCIIALLIIGFLTMSKTFVVCLLIMFTMFFIDRRKSFNKRMKYLLYVLLILLFVGVLMLLLFPDVLDKFLMRWQENDIFSGRFSIMNEASTCIWSNPQIYLFGIGLQDYSKNVLHYVSYAPHDALNEILMAWGVPGFLMLVMFILSIILGAKKKNKNMGLVNLIPIMIILAKAIAGHLITSDYTMLSISLAYLSLVQDFSNSGNQYKVYNREND